MTVWEEAMLVGQVCKVALETHRTQRQSQHWLLSLASRLGMRPSRHTLPACGANSWKEPVPSPPTQAVVLWLLCCWMPHRPPPHGLSSQHSEPPISVTTGYPEGPDQLCPPWANPPHPS